MGVEDWEAAAVAVLRLLMRRHGCEREADSADRGDQRQTTGYVRYFQRSNLSGCIGLLVLSVLSALAFRLCQGLRDYADEDREQACDILAKLEEMHLKGDITDEEFRTMKARAHSHLLDSTNDKDSPPKSEESTST